MGARARGLLAVLALSAAMVASLPALAAKYAAIVVDARTGEVLHEENADTVTHPASLTKMMTLYLTFDALDEGRLTLDQALPVSAWAEAQSPTKLGLRAGQSLRVEQALWKTAGLDPAAGDGWYRSIGQGMGATLNTAAAVGGYALTDRGTWLSFKNPGDLEVVVEGDKRLFNQYGVMLVNPAKFAHVKAADGQAFVDWLVSGEGQTAIADYTINGQSLFFPNANEPGA